LEEKKENVFNALLQTAEKYYLQQELVKCYCAYLHTCMERRKTERRIDRKTEKQNRKMRKNRGAK
jgi:hypothetical protein